MVTRREPRAAVPWHPLLIDALHAFVGLCSVDGVVLQANASALAASGVGADEVIGRPLWDAPWWRGNPSAQRRLRDAVAQAARGQASRFDVEARIRGGRIASIDFQLVPVIEDGVVTAIVPSGVDITSRVADRRRLEALTILSRHLNGAMTTTQVSRLVVAHGNAVVAADFLNVALLDEEGVELHLVQPMMDADIEQRWQVVGPGTPRTPFHEVLETARPVFVDRDERLARYPDMVADTDRVGLDTTAAVPLLDEAGRPFGVLGAGWAVQVVVDEHLRFWLELLADLVAHALRRARRTERQDLLVRQLQDEVLAPPESSPGLDVAVTYEPAQADIGFGGDWYDVIVIDEEKTALVVGDVAGHGMQAAARMTETKATIRAMALTSHLDDVMPLATRALDHFGSAYVATAAVACIDTANDVIHWRLAGHVPPVLRIPGEPARLLAGPHHPPIGMPMAPRAQEALPFPVGSLLVLYTDGLIERRDEDLDESLERLRALVDALPPECGATEAQHRLVRDLRVLDSSDDLAMVVVQRR